MVDLKQTAPIIPGLRPTGLSGNFFHNFNDLNAKETASWHAFRV